ncbi:MAG: hypothetical protein J6N46_08375, partial [Bacteroidales bacterium]|nr:hypothetical protein [Bacteroidales bacterium]
AISSVISKLLLSGLISERTLIEELTMFWFGSTNGFSLEHENKEITNKKEAKTLLIVLIEIKN